MITTYFKNLTMNNIFHTAAFAVLPTRYYLAWSTVIPPDNGVGSEFAEPATATGYARIEMTGLRNAVNGKVDNGAILSFPESVADQGVALAYGVYDAISGGHLLIYDSLTKPKTIEAGTILSIKSTDLTFTLKGI